MSTVFGHVPSLDPDPLAKLYTDGGTVVSRVHRLLGDVSVLGSKDEFTPSSDAVTSFVELEKLIFDSRLELIKFDVDALRSVVSGTETLTPLLEVSLKALSKGRTPPRWRVPESDDREVGVIESTINLASRASALKRLSMSAQLGSPVVYELRSFERPDGFLNAVLRHTTRQQFKNLHSTSLTIECANSGNTTADAIVLDGLKLHNASWNASTSSVLLAASQHPMRHDTGRQHPIVSDLPDVILKLSSRDDRRRKRGPENQLRLIRCPVGKLVAPDRMSDNVIGVFDIQSSGCEESESDCTMFISLK